MPMMSDKIEKLNLLGTYEERIRRSMSKTLAMIRDVEGGCKGVIDLQ